MRRVRFSGRPTELPSAEADPTGAAEKPPVAQIEKGCDMWLMRILAETSWPDFTSFGAAGLMGAMWLWERKTSRQREEQLDEAHVRILGDRVQLEQLISVVRQNSEAMTRLSAVQDELVRKMDREQQKEAKGDS